MAAFWHPLARCPQAAAARGDWEAFTCEFSYAVASDEGAWVVALSTIPGRQGTSLDMGRILDDQWTVLAKAGGESAFST